MNSMYELFKSNIQEKKLLKFGESVLLSLSAGKDSMLLLHFALQLAKELNLRIGVFHLNHLMRGIESDEDENFLKNLVNSLNIESYFEKFDFINQRDKSKSFEEQARSVRYSLLKRIQIDNKFDKIMTAHNYNDNVETVFMRILSGTGINGLQGIPEQNNIIIRPLMMFQVPEIYNYLNSQSIMWREDESNINNDYQRNYIRNEIFPALESRFDNFLKSINNLSILAVENQSLLNNLTKNKYNESVSLEDDRHIINIAVLDYDESLIKFILADILRNIYGQLLSYPVYNEILRKLGGNKTNIELYNTQEIKIYKGIHNGNRSIFISSNTFEPEVPDKWEYPLKSITTGTSIYIDELGIRLTFKRMSFDEFEIAKNSKIVAFAISDMNSQIVVRNRRPGDFIYLEMGRKKIKDLMIEKKLDSVVKKKVPMIVIDNEIAVYLPLPGSDDNFRISKKYWIDKNSSHIFSVHLN